MQESTSTIKILDGGSIHKITSGQVVVDLQTAVKELVENSLDAGATTIEVRFKDYGLDSFEVIDNGSGIPPADYDTIALKHHTSKLSSFTDLEAVTTFGFRGEALSSLCALAESVSVTTATAAEAPVGTVIEFERSGKAKDRKVKAARQRGTTVTVSGLFKPLPVRRKELERRHKAEFGKALALLHAYALVPCAKENRGVRLTVTNQPAGGKKSVQLRTDGAPSTRASVSAIWGPKALENLVDLDLAFDVELEAAVLRRLGKTQDEEHANEVKVKGLVSKFAVGCGRNGTDRQFFFVNGRPCAPSKVQKAFNEVYRSFNATQSPFVVADFIIPTNSCDVNVSPDKRTILLHSENNLVQALKIALEEKYAPARSTFAVMNTTQAGASTQIPRPLPRATPDEPTATAAEKTLPLFLPDEAHDGSPATLASVGAGQADDTSEIGDEVAFGEPGAPLLAQPSRAPVESQEAQRDGGDGGVGAQDPVDRARRGPEGACGRARSPTVTQMFDRMRSRSRSRSSDATDRDGIDADDARVKSSTRAGSSSSTATHARSARKLSVVPDPPIPAVKPPARPTTHTASSQPTYTGKGGQMVLSTAGASWSLRRRAEEPGAAERPRKRGRVDGPEPAAARRGAREGMREMLRGFARKGSGLEEAEVVDGDEDGDEDKDESEGVSENGAMDVDVDEGRDVGEDERGGIDKAMSGDDEDGEVHEDTPDKDIPTADPSESQDIVMEDADAGSATDIIEIPKDDEGTQVTVERSDLGSSSAAAVSEEIVRMNNREGVSLAFDLSRISSSWKRMQARLASALRERAALQQAPAPGAARVSGSVDVADEDATEALSRVIDKTDFGSMDVVGQFNLGFIIVRRRKNTGTEDGARGAEMDDLFIVDQHAADEKYNFETLQHTTKIDSQKLFHPQVLELTAADELVALENVDVLRQNGFELETFEDRPPGQRVQLSAQPISKSTVFDMKDLEELLHLLQDRPAGQMVRCSKARAMFAMRACRKSIMIGTPLSRRQMVSVVRHMGTMDQPWHCPHGRPTMRHLSDITGLGWDRRQDPARSVDWAAFGRAEV